MKIGVVDVGGGMRGIYRAGVFDRCIDDKVTFDYGIGVSAGSANISSFMADQRGRNKVFFGDYSFRKDYMSFRNFIKKGSYLDVEYIYGALSNADGEYPLDYEKIIANPMEFVIVASEAVSGKTKYFHKSDIHQDDYGVFKASSSIPVVCKPFYINGTAYYDGALGDPVPVQKALDDGCDKLVVVLTKPRDTVRQPEKDTKLAKLLKRKYPKASYNMAHRAERYNKGVDLAKKLEKEGNAIIVAPDSIEGMKTLTTSHEAFDMLYKKGYNDGAVIKSFVSGN